MTPECPTCGIPGDHSPVTEHNPSTDSPLSAAARTLLDAMEANRDGDIIRAAKALDAIFERFFYRSPDAGYSFAEFKSDALTILEAAAHPESRPEPGERDCGKEEGPDHQHGYWCEPASDYPESRRDPGEGLRTLLLGVEVAHERHRSGSLGPTGVSALLTDIAHGLRGALAAPVPTDRPEPEAGLREALDVPAGVAAWAEVAAAAIARNGSVDWDDEKRLAEDVAAKLWNYLVDGLIPNPAALCACFEEPETELIVAAYRTEPGETT